MAIIILILISAFIALCNGDSSGIKAIGAFIGCVFLFIVVGSIFVFMMDNPLIIIVLIAIIILIVVLYNKAKNTKTQNIETNVIENTPNSNVILNPRTS